MAKDCMLRYKRNGRVLAAASIYRDVESLDQVDRIAQSPGQLLCATHGTDRLCRALGALPDANLFYLNAPYGDSGAYVWI